MTSTDPRENIQRLRALVTDDLYKLVDPTNRAAVIGWGTTFNVIYFVDGMVQLHDAGNCFATSPLRRSAMEYAMTTVWLADAPDDATDALNSGLQYKQGLLVNAMTKAGAHSRFPEDAIQSAQAVIEAQLPKATQANLLNISHLLDAYDSTVDGDGRIPLRLVYNVESSLVHASLMGAQAFFVERDNAFALGTKPEPPEFVPCLDLGLSLLFTAMLSYNELLIGKPWTETLHAVAKDAGLDPTLPKRRELLPKERKASKKQ